MIYPSIDWLIDWLIDFIFWFCMLLFCFPEPVGTSKPLLFLHLLNLIFPLPTQRTRRTEIYLHITNIFYIMPHAKLIDIFLGWGNVWIPSLFPIEICKSQFDGNQALQKRRFPFFVCFNSCLRHVVIVLQEVPRHWSRNISEPEGRGPSTSSKPCPKKSGQVPLEPQPISFGIAHDVKFNYSLMHRYYPRTLSVADTIVCCAYSAYA